MIRYLVVLVIVNSQILEWGYQTEVINDLIFMKQQDINDQMNLVYQTVNNIYNHLQSKQKGIEQQRIEQKSIEYEDYHNRILAQKVIVSKDGKKDQNINWNYHNTNNTYKCQNQGQQIDNLEVYSFVKKSNDSLGLNLRQISKQEYESTISSYCGISQNSQINICIQNKQYREYDYKDSTKNYVLHLYPEIVQDGVFLSFVDNDKTGCLCPVDFIGDKCETYVTPICEFNLKILNTTKVDSSRFDYNQNLNGGDSPQNIIIDDRVDFESTFKCYTNDYQNMQEKIFMNTGLYYLQFDQSSITGLDYMKYYMIYPTIKSSVILNLQYQFNQINFNDITNTKIYGFTIKNDWINLSGQQSYKFYVKLYEIDSQFGRYYTTQTVTNTVNVYDKKGNKVNVVQYAQNQLYDRYFDRYGYQEPKQIISNSKVLLVLIIILIVLIVLVTIVVFVQKKVLSKYNGSNKVQQQR